MADRRPPEEPSARDRQADRLLSELLDLPPDRRARRLREACGEDSRLRQQVASLLAAADATDSLLRPGGAIDDEFLRHLTVGSPLQPGADLGRYRLLREIGRGGMGVVYLAERADGHFDQRVAIKVLSFGGDRTAQERFARERQILADLEHPHIARLLDGGVTDEGHPFLVMEFVDGLALDRYCRDKGLALKARLGLVSKVCEAVQAAHGQLVVHRDLKPSNILVTGDGQIKLLDFGIAKLLAPSAGQTEAPAQDLTSANYLTPQYASPEQVRGEAITVASDIYQLGMLAFELLAGCLPYDVRTVTAAEAERAICQEDVARPSEMRALLPAKDVAPGLPSAQELRGDLDTIVLEALRKEPGRRYESVGRLRDDLNNYLAGLPVSARPDTWHYRLGKFIRRNALPVAATVGTALLIAFLVISFTIRLARERDQTLAAAQRAEQQRQIAETRSREAVAVEDFLIDLFDVSDPNLSGAAGRDLTALEILQRGLGQLRDPSSQNLRGRARLFAAVGKIYSHLELFDEADDILQEALRIAENAPGDHRLEHSYVLGTYGDFLYQAGKTPEAIEPLRQTLALRRDVLPAGHERIATAAAGLANVLLSNGQAEESARLATEALVVMEALDRPDPGQFSFLLCLLGQAKLQHGEFQEAEAVLLRALDHSRQHFEEESFQHVQVIESLSHAYINQGKHEAAIPLLEQAIRSHNTLLGPNSFKVALTQQTLAASYVGLGELAEATRLQQDALAIVAEIAGADSRAAISLRHNLASLRLDQGDAAGAEADFRELRADQERTLVPSHPFHGITLGDLGRALTAQGKDREAEAVLLESLAQIEEHSGPRGQFITYTLLNLGRLYRSQGRVEEAEPLLRRALDIRRETMAADSPEVEEARAELLDFLRDTGRSGEAEASGSARVCGG
ncbi:MAG: serine/threonine-protein kinase [Acidobacteriota bacterium]